MSIKKSAKQPKKQNKRKKVFTTRNGIVLVALLAVLILLVSVVTLSYSWFEPQSRPGTGMEYRADAAVRSQNCSIKGTYAGTVTNGAITYDKTNSLSGTQSVSGDIKYFLTEIENADPAPTNISLFIGSLPAASSDYYGLGVAVPSNSYRKISSAQTDYYIIRNAYINGFKDGHNGELTVEWFIRPEGNTVDFNVNNLYIMYN
ncbi:hypothetical protein [Ruminococcus sp.]|uniref:hypothetical protein n=1 Tax=Ruminococcus sp. TaxID=41978 RepID=UPI002E818BD2|nr:hypothetical protein [Ruminococcus sp.]MEE3492258.1 hypothetical protein [Ruminococcus sp.]